MVPPPGAAELGVGDRFLNTKLLDGVNDGKNENAEPVVVLKLEKYAMVIVLNSPTAIRVVWTSESLLPYTLELLSSGEASVWTPVTSRRRLMESMTWPDIIYPPAVGAKYFKRKAKGSRAVPLAAEPPSGA